MPGDALTDNDDKTGLWAGRLLLGLLALLSAAFMVSGGFFYGWVVADYLQYDSPFTGLQMLGWMLGLFAAGVVSVGLLLAGVLFRLMPWSRAPLASLALAMTAVGFVILTYLVFSDTGHGGDSIEVVVLRGVCIIYLFVIALPPFLHWVKAKPEPVASQTPRTGS
jgi:hypothetical protein